jgi:D-alanyl-D-alanine carboxypeptidase/D-alanyl-D-alanine-endopeptidase (penicillin-binding protein 4)
VCLLAVQIGETDCDAGFGPMSEFLTDAGVDLTEVVLNDGRGGDPADRATPVSLTQILRFWLDRPDFDRFRAALPILGVDGSLANVATDSPAKGKVFAKTGTLAAGDSLNGRVVLQAKALAGFFQQADGGWAVFDAVVNNGGGSTDIQFVLDANEDVGQVAAQLWRGANP